LPSKDIAAREAKLCFEALDRLDRKLSLGQPETSCEDLFFISKRAALECDPEVAGKMHTARSRNDIDITLYRMALRREILQLTAALLEASQVLLDWASDHVRTLIPAYTHSQPAQPTTLHTICWRREFLDATRSGSKPCLPPSTEVRLRLRHHYTDFPSTANSLRLLGFQRPPIQLTGRSRPWITSRKLPGLWLSP